MAILCETKPPTPILVRWRGEKPSPTKLNQIKTLSLHDELARTYDAIFDGTSTVPQLQRQPHLASVLLLAPFDSQPLEPHAAHNTSAVAFFLCLLWLFLICKRELLQARQCKLIDAVCNALLRLPPSFQQLLPLCSAPRSLPSKIMKVDGR